MLLYYLCNRPLRSLRTKDNLLFRRSIFRKNDFVTEIADGLGGVSFEFYYN